MRQPHPATALLAALMVAVAAPVTAAPAVPTSCPAAATAQLDGFYQWFLARGLRYRDDFASQEQRFTAEFFHDLRRGFALQPAEGGSVDFDPFSNTQVASYGYRIDGCRRDGGESLIVRVGVLAGLRRRGASEQPLDYVLIPQGKGWRIADIQYPATGGFRLGAFLRDLLQHRNP